MEIDLEFDWKDFAACADIDFDVEDSPFFAEGYGATYQKGREYCARCPVVIDCLIEGLEDPDNLGMWGCTSPNERHEILAKLARGWSLITATESIWAKERRKKRGVTVPSKSVWSDWDA